MAAVRAATRVVSLTGFDDPRIAPPIWDHLVASGPTQSVFLTYWWQRAWWETFGGDALLLLLALETEGAITAIAPLFESGGMLFLVGSGGSDALDLIGGPAGTGGLASLLDAAWEAVPSALGIRFYCVPDGSPTGSDIRTAAATAGLTCFDEGELVSPMLDLRADGALDRATSKQSLRRHENWFVRNGRLEITHHTDPQLIAENLDLLFEQHISRWSGTPSPSLFLDAKQQAFYRHLAGSAGPGTPLRFTRVDWEGKPIACHFGTSYAGRYLWYKPCFDVALAARSPGEVLLRSLLFAASDEGAAIFDFGLGDEPFKARFATSVPTVRTWGCYPPGEA